MSYPSYDLTFIQQIRRQSQWSLRTFGPGARTSGIVDHIRKELVEVEQSGGDLSEWIDVLILALDGCWRTGSSAEDIGDAITVKFRKNELREWPDWRQQPADKAIEHRRGGDHD